MGAVRASYERARRSSGMDYAIEAQGLRNAFGDTQALAGVDLPARPGSVLGAPDTFALDESSSGGHPTRAEASAPLP